MTNDKQITGTRDTTYNLISVIYHALQGAETYEMYIVDAKQEGNEELLQFFRDVQEQNRQLAERGKKLLREQLQQSEPG